VMTVIDGGNLSSKRGNIFVFCRQSTKNKVIGKGSTLMSDWHYRRYFIEVGNRHCENGRKRRERRI
jgi:hypothetical protein